MKEPRQAIVCAIDGTTDECSDMRGSHETMSRDLTHNRYVVVGDAKCGRSLGTSESWPARWYGNWSIIHAQDIAAFISLRHINKTYVTQCEQFSLRCIDFIAVHGDAYHPHRDY
jgi:hypothetical protein